MKELTLFGIEAQINQPKFGAVKVVNFIELSMLWNIDESVIRRVVKELWPDKIKNGIRTELTEQEAAIIKEKIIENKRIDLGFKAEVVSNADDDLIIIRGLEAAQRKLIKMQEEIDTMKPKAISFDELQRSEETMSITEAGKHFGIPPKKTIFPYLREKLYLTTKDLPSQKALDENIMSTVENKGHDNQFRAQAVVKKSQLENWRVKLIPAMKKWMV